MFIAILIQKGEGCGYGIGCGIAAIELEAKTLEEALKELFSYIVGVPCGNDKFENGFWDKNYLQSVDLLEVASVTEIPVEKWYEKARTMNTEIDSAKAEMEERALYEKLRRKFEQNG